MKIINQIFRPLVLILLVVSPVLLMAQASATGAGKTLWTTGKINVVILVAAIIFSGIALFLILLERKISRLEKKITDKN
jgi:hypothetical protein